jgi:protein LSM14
MAMTTTPFLGCKISLISKSEIRYEGILYTIDPKESTIALAKVRSYGTEDRSAERQVPPREEIFEYIIFRAGDIKDLIVDDPPTSIAPGLADPAIIQAHSTSTPSGATFPSTTFPQMTTTSSISATSGQRATGPAFNSGTNAINSLTGLGAGIKSNNSVDSRSQNSTPTGGQHNRHSPQNDGTTNGSAVKHIPNKENQRKNIIDRGQPQQFHRRPNNSGGGGGGHGGQQNFQNYSHQNRRGSGQQNYRHNQTHHTPQQSGNRFGSSANYNRQFNYSSGGRRPQSRPQQQRGSQNRIPNRVPKEPLKFDSDYDFDKANHEFKELEEKLSNIKLDGTPNSDNPTEADKQSAPESKATDHSTNGVKELVESDHCYDKTKSFFDNISCEALEREKGNVQRIDWKAERKLNSETFGVPLSYRFRGFGRGRGGYANRGYSQPFRSNRGGGFGRGGGDTRRYSGPPRPRNN